ncbi:MAG: hypothetical protein FWH14_03055 [Oscillospiraceae bacterium]|nr:hypothetical protein [Oscillospiraceae bacterium]
MKKAKKRILSLSIVFAILLSNLTIMSLFSTVSANDELPDKQLQLALRANIANPPVWQWAGEEDGFSFPNNRNSMTTWFSHMGGTHNFGEFNPAATGANKSRGINATGYKYVYIEMGHHNGSYSMWLQNGGNDIQAAPGNDNSEARGLDTTGVGVNRAFRNHSGLYRMEFPEGAARTDVQLRINFAEALGVYSRNNDSADAARDNAGEYSIAYNSAGVKFRRADWGNGITWRQVGDDNQPIMVDDGEGGQTIGGLYQSNNDGLRQKGMNQFEIKSVWLSNDPQFSPYGDTDITLRLFQRNSADVVSGAGFTTEDGYKITHGASQLGGGNFFGVYAYGDDDKLFERDLVRWDKANGALGTGYNMGTQNQTNSGNMFEYANSRKDEDNDYDYFDYTKGLLTNFEIGTHRYMYIDVGHLGKLNRIDFQTYVNTQSLAFNSVNLPELFDNPDFSGLIRIDMAKLRFGNFSHHNGANALYTSNFALNLVTDRPGYEGEPTVINRIFLSNKEYFDSGTVVAGDTPNKVDYVRGDTFDPAGATLLADAEDMFVINPPYEYGRPDPVATNVETINPDFFTYAMPASDYNPLGLTRADVFQDFVGQKFPVAVTADMCSVNGQPIASVMNATGTYSVDVNYGGTEFKDAFEITVDNPSDPVNPNLTVSLSHTERVIGLPTTVTVALDGMTAMTPAIRGIEILLEMSNFKVGEVSLIDTVDIKTADFGNDGDDATRTIEFFDEDVDDIKEGTIKYVLESTENVPKNGAVLSPSLFVFDIKTITETADPEINPNDLILKDAQDIDFTITSFKIVYDENDPIYNNYDIKPPHDVKVYEKGVTPNLPKVALTIVPLGAPLEDPTLTMSVNFGDIAAEDFKSGDEITVTVGYANYDKEIHNPVGAAQIMVEIDTDLFDFVQGSQVDLLSDKLDEDDYSWTLGYSTNAQSAVVDGDKFKPSDPFNGVIYIFMFDDDESGANIDSGKGVPFPENGGAIDLFSFKLKAKTFDGPPTATKTGGFALREYAFSVDIEDPNPINPNFKGTVTAPAELEEITDAVTATDKNGEVSGFDVGAITVTRGEEVAVLVTGISISTQPTTTTYTLGHTGGVSLAGGKVTISYDNSTTEVVDLDNAMFEFSPALGSVNFGVAGQVTITVKLIGTEFTDTFSITVRDPSNVGNPGKVTNSGDGKPGVADYNIIAFLAGGYSAEDVAIIFAASGPFDFDNAKVTSSGPVGVSDYNVVAFIAGGYSLDEVKTIFPSVTIIMDDSNW